MRDPSVGDTRAPDRAWLRHRAGVWEGAQDGRMERFPWCEPRPPSPDVLLPQHTQGHAHNLSFALSLEFHPIKQMEGAAM